MTTWFNSHLVLWVEPLYLQSLEAIGLAKKEMLILNFSYVFTRLRNQRVIWLHGWLFDTIRHHSAKSGGIDLVEKDIKFSNLHVTSCDHVIRAVWLDYELCLTICQYLANFAGHAPFEGRNILLLVCHVTSWLEEYVTSWVHSPHHKSPTSQFSWP